MLCAYLVELWPEGVKSTTDFHCQRMQHVIARPWEMNPPIMKGESAPRKEHFRVDVMESIFTTLSCNEKESELLLLKLWMRMRIPVRLTLMLRCKPKVFLLLGIISRNDF